MSRRVQENVIIKLSPLPSDIVKKLSLVSGIEEPTVQKMTQYNVCTVIQVADLLSLPQDLIYGHLNRGNLTTCYPLEQRNQKVFVLMDRHFINFIEDIL